MRYSSILQGAVVQDALAGIVETFADAVPDIVAGVVFLAIALVGVRIVRTVFRRALARIAADEPPASRQFVETVVAVFLWFAVALTFLSIVGLGELAASLGTATGFVALGVAYALSGMIEDVVAGVYLLRDPDFEPGDTVTAGETTGEVRSIELRKTRFDVDGDVVVRANADVEQRWTKRGG